MSEDQALLHNTPRRQGGALVKTILLAFSAGALAGGALVGVSLRGRGPAPPGADVPQALGKSSGAKGRGDAILAKVDDDCHDPWCNSKYESYKEFLPECDGELPDWCRCGELGGGKKCGVNTCTQDVLDTLAGTYTCGARIDDLIKVESMSEEDACAQVGGEEFPKECGGCESKEAQKLCDHCDDLVKACKHGPFGRNLDQAKDDLRDAYGEWKYAICCQQCNAPFQSCVGHKDLTA